MKVIQFKEDKKEIWNKFIAFNNSESFLQSWQWGEFQKNIGRKVWRLMVTDDLSSKNETIKSQINSKFPAQNEQLRLGQKNSQPKVGPPRAEKLIAVALIIKYDLPFGKSYLYCPRGPVINESRISNILFCEIKKIAKKEKSFFLKIDPPVELSQKCFNNFRKSFSEVQPKDTLILDLEKSEEDLSREMKQKTRYNVRLAKKKGVEVKDYKLGITDQGEFRKKLDFFWDLTEETSKRDKFISHNKEYYQKMLESLNDKSRSLDNKQNLYARLYLAEYEKKIIAANIVLYFGDLAVYLHGSSSSKYRNLMAPYLLQWKQIQDAKTQGYKKYDFWGITIDGENKNWQGITKFKKGFGGKEKSYIGSYDLVFDNVRYWVYRFVRFIKSKK